MKASESIWKFWKNFRIELYFNKVTGLGLLLYEETTPPEILFLQFFGKVAPADTDTTDDNDMPIWDFQFTCIIEGLFLSAETKIVFNL